jgi:hypothetical protein
VPPLVGVAVKVTLVPAHIVCAPVVMAVDTEGVTAGFTVIVYVFETVPIGTGVVLFMVVPSPI